MTDALSQMEFCFVPHGPFWMGSDTNDLVASDWERPQHVHLVANDFWIGRTPVSIAQFKSLAQTLQRRSARPVVNVSWHDALRYCNGLTQRWRTAGILSPSQLVRLPTEPEWEKAARGGLHIPVAPITVAASLIHPMHTHEVALMENPSPTRRYPWGDQPVAGSDKQSPYGCVEMAGNVWEWCMTKVCTDYRAYIENNDVLGDEARIVRGGAFERQERFARCAFRYWHDPEFQFELIGFRVVIAQT
jgi:iron(II)-dependent oxidoreductase